MDAAFVIDLIRQACFLILKISAPILSVGFIVGLVISLFQALTQIQEATISFVPKLIVILCATFLSFDFMLTHLMQFTYMLFRNIHAV